MWTGEDLCWSGEEENKSFHRKLINPVDCGFVNETWDMNLSRPLEQTSITDSIYIRHFSADQFYICEIISPVFMLEE